MDIAVVRRFRRSLRRLERLLEAILRDETCCHGVSVAQCHALMGMDELERPSLGGLAVHMGLDKSTLSRTVDGLVKAGLVLREQGGVDRRKTLLLLTENGKALCQRIHTDNDALFVKVLEGVEVASDQVISVFEGLVESLSRQGRSAAQGSKGCGAGAGKMGPGAIAGDSHD
ncbi:MAG: MarR family transcriptional regulator [Syntrophobacteraceae bacterium]|nr:MarR family transcriptional regulator [Syntrophobacteraceae bacterium]